MTHLGWFFAGTSFGIILGVFLTSLARIEDTLREQRPMTQPSPKAPLILVRR